MDIRKSIRDELKEVAPKRRIMLPRDVEFDYKEKTLTITIHDKGIGYGFLDSKGKINYSNMQDDGAAFEGWAIVVKTYWNKNEQYKVKLAVDCDLPDVNDTFIKKTHPEVSSGHYGRFLYRAYKFREEFEWFELEEKLDHAVKDYNDLITNKVIGATNHLPDGDAGINRHNEIRVEKAFADHPDELIKISDGKISGKVYRQLDVWLESGDGKNQFLTSGRSAIDLWNLSNSALNIFELKAKNKKNNIKVGIISELFFYAEYCSDFYGKHARFELRQPEEGRIDRGYSELYCSQINRVIKNVNAFFLTDDYHPLVKKETTRLLNTNRKQIKYTLLENYDLEKMLSYTEDEF